MSDGNENRGIGLEVARQLARRGFQVVVAARDESSASQAVKGIESAGGKATFLRLDVSDSQKHSRYVQAVRGDGIAVNSIPDHTG